MLLVEIASYYLAVQLVTLLVLPLTCVVCRRLPDSGYTLTKAMGVLTIGLVYWLGWSYGAWSANRHGLLLSVLAWAVIGVALVANKQKLSQSLGRLVARERWPIIIVTEVVFLAVYLGWLWVRGHAPAVAHTEQPADLMLLNALWYSRHYPPLDPWLSGMPISYYYLGYWFMDTLGWLAVQSPLITYNLGQACWYAMLWVGALGLGYNLVLLSFPDRILKGLTGGLLTAASVAFLSNVRAAYDAVVDHHAALWWWPASRVLHDADSTGRLIDLITEFPFFSYYLGDNHPHTLAMPFLLLVLGLSLNLFMDLRCSKLDLFSSFIARWRLLFCLIFSTAALIAINPWDYPLAVALAVGAYFLAVPSVKQAVKSGLFVLLLVGAGILIAWPYIATAQSQVLGLAWNTFRLASVKGFFLVFGFFFPGVLLFILLWWKNRVTMPSPSQPFVALLLVLAVLIVVGTQLFYINDFFHSRMNTIFKFYYQVWLLLAIVSAYGIVSTRIKILRWLALLIMVGATIYPVRALAELARSSWRGMNVLAAMAAADPDRYAMVKWVRSNIGQRTIVLEAPGTSYHEDNNAVSIFTGRPTLLGWQGHELQWRGLTYSQISVARLAALFSIYHPDDPETLKNTLKSWQINYVVVGPQERRQYLFAEREVKIFAKVMTPIYSNQTFTVWHRK